MGMDDIEGYGMECTSLVLALCLFINYVSIYVGISPNLEETVL